jgi:uncharacterized protein YjbJ (UPF0337 family)
MVVGEKCSSLLRLVHDSKGLKDEALHGLADSLWGVHRISKLWRQWSSYRCESKYSTEKENAMNWDQVEGKWKQSKGKFREKWGKLTDDDLEVISGKRDQLVGRLQERYGIAHEEAEKQADAFVKGLNEQEKAASARH